CNCDPNSVVTFARAASKLAEKTSANKVGPGVPSRILHILPISGLLEFCFLKYTSALIIKSYLFSSLFNLSVASPSSLWLAATSWYSKWIFIFFWFGYMNQRYDRQQAASKF